MKAGKIRLIYIVALIGTAVCATSWLGCKADGTSANRRLREASSPVKANDVAWEYKTVTKKVSPDRQKAVKELRQQMQQFAQEGWLCVVSLQNASSARRNDPEEVQSKEG